MSLLESVLIVLCDHGLSAVKNSAATRLVFGQRQHQHLKVTVLKKKKQAQVTEPHIDSIELKSIEMKIEL